MEGKLGRMHGRWIGVNEKSRPGKSDDQMIVRLAW